MRKIKKVKVTIPVKKTNFSYKKFSEELTRIIKKSDLKTKRIGIVVGSRGIRNHLKILRRLIAALNSVKAKPFLLPAMGMHGMGKPTKEKEILISRGYSKLNIPIISSSKQVQIGKALGKPIYLNETINKADFLIPVNTIKSHTSFMGPIESGISKILVVGLGSKKGAEIFHKTAKEHGFYETLTIFRGIILKKAPVLFGIGIVEYDSQLYNVSIIEPAKIDTIERKLLKKAKAILPKIRVKNADLLILEEFGKDIAGDGFDPNIIGGAKGKEKIAKFFFAKKLTKESHGNAQGMGLLDFISERFFRSINFEKTYLNAIIGQVPHYAKLPITVKNETQCMEKVAQIRNKDITELKIIWIKNTRELKQYFVTKKPQKNARSNSMKMNL